MNKTVIAIALSMDLRPLSVAEQTGIKGGKVMTCEEKRRTVRKP